MAIDIASHTGDLVRNFSETMDRLQRLQAVTAECGRLEDLQDTWILREYFMQLAESQWDDLANLLLRDVLPFVADFRKGVRHG